MKRKQIEEGKVRHETLTIQIKLLRGGNAMLEAERDELKEELEKVK